jgi:shikimate dehydrogenase
MNGGDPSTVFGSIPRNTLCRAAIQGTQTTPKSNSEPDSPWPNPVQILNHVSSPAMPTTIDGQTRLYGIVGDPIFQVKSPGGITAQFAARGANAILVPMHVRPDGFDAFMAAMRGLLNLEGLVLTIPHKMSVVKHLDQMTDRVRFLGAANVIRRVAPGGGWTGDVTDGLGMVNALRASGFDLRRKRALLVGAGGAGSAIALSLIEEGVAELAIHDALAARRDSLVSRLKEKGANVCVGSPDPSGFDLAINATPTGAKADDPLPIEAEKLTSGTFAADVITAPVRTRFLEVAAARGCRTQVGTAMFAGQVDLVAEYLLAAPRE